MTGKIDLIHLQPLIEGISWGQIVVHLGEETLSFKDCRLWPGHAVKWDWGISGTHHSPGILPADFTDMLANGLAVMVLSRGMLLRLRVSTQALTLLEENEVEYQILETRKAAEEYNRLAKAGVRVGGLFHATC